MFVNFIFPKKRYASLATAKFKNKYVLSIPKYDLFFIFQLVKGLALRVCGHYI